MGLVGWGWGRWGGVGVGGMVGGKHDIQWEELGGNLAPIR